MSYQLIRSALEARLEALLPVMPIAWENKSFQQVVGTPYQRVNLLPAQTDNPTFGDGLRMEAGVFQVMVCYPIGVGAKDAIARAELIRNQFARGLSLTSGSVTVRINRTPSIGAALNEPGLYVIPVSISYFAYI